MATSSDDISLSGVLSEMKGIIKENINHFFILQLLFLLPFSLLMITYTTIFPVGSDSNFTFLRIIYLIVTCVFSISATGTITYSAFHGYYNRPLELIPTLKSLSSSFIPLVSTSIVTALIYFPVFFLFGILGAVMYSWLESFTYWKIILGFMFFFCLIYFQLNWFISNVIVVVELKWGYEPLRRSAYLMKGMKLIALKMTALFGVLSYMYMYSYFWNLSKPDNTDGFRQWLCMIVGGSCWMTVVMGYGLVAIVVLYIYCMKTHGELAMEIQPEEYVSLLVDDDGDKPVTDVVH